MNQTQQKSKKTTKKKTLTVKEKIDKFAILFPDPVKAQQIKVSAQALIDAGLGKRKIKGQDGQYRMESDLEYAMRVDYCLENHIPLCFINQTYILEGNVNEMVELKLWILERTHPQAEIKCLFSNGEKMKKIGRASPEDNWIPVEWSIEKAKQLKLYHASKKQWTDNTISMLNARCDGQLCDILTGVRKRSGYLCKEEIINNGIELEEDGE